MEKRLFMKQWFSFLLVMCLFSFGFEKKKKQTIVISRKDQVAQQRFNDALEKYEKGKMEEIPKLLEEVITINKNLKEPYILLSKVQFENQQIDDAVKTLQSFAQILQNKDSAYYLIALIYYQSQQWDKALDYANQAISVNGKDYKLHYLSGLIKDRKSVV
jgi:tetratricopeptide (TPR) repeat protein